MTTIRLRGSIFQRMVQRQSIVSHADTHHSKHSSQRSFKKLTEANKEEVKEYRGIPERMRSKSEIGLSYPSPQKHGGKESVARKGLRRNSYWGRGRLSRHGQRQENSKIVLRESVKKLLAASHCELVLLFNNVKALRALRECKLLQSL
eukprot:TRINITY_DN6760_c0_g1_i10.p2 TRINITY_DN6760_c0_g1~~TRINITY_DN6760_c0_g1_i10.p2  ORF type:complete len:148 (+),score=17.59 TRINITY_DN6760_c0_g1_i10:98-541(+)